MGEGRSELGSFVRDDSVMKAKLGEDVMEKDVGNVSGGGSFVARVENYPLRKTMVYHDQNRIIAVGDRKVCNEVHGDLLEGVTAFGRGRGKWGVGGVGVDLIGLTSGTTSDKFLDEGGYTRPPVVLLEQRDGAEISAVGSGKEFMNVFDKGVPGGFGDIEAQFVIEGTLVKVPVIFLGMG